MAASRMVPLIVISTGAAIAVINGITLTVWNVYFPKWLAAVPVLMLLGAAMLIFPGAEAPPGVDEATRTRHYWKAAPMSRKAIWIAFGAVGLVISLYVGDFLGGSAR